MNAQIDEVFRAALALSDDDQLQLLAALTSALDERGVRPFDDSWLAEIQRRSEEYDSGAVRPIPWSEVKQRLRDPLGQEPTGA